mmetsp:Transcript_4184/g.15689  ORF Transcript_4184/g.15689 Transcript_4184/m.15689 type:complete len:204 (+) Transcript_4184:167-778(+)
MWALLPRFPKEGKGDGAKRRQQSLQPELARLAMQGFWQRTSNEAHQRATWSTQSSERSRRDRSELGCAEGVTSTSTSPPHTVKLPCVLWVSPPIVTRLLMCISIWSPTHLIIKRIIFLSTSSKPPGMVLLMRSLTAASSSGAKASALCESTLVSEFLTRMMPALPFSNSSRHERLASAGRTIVTGTFNLMATTCSKMVQMRVK